MARTQAKYPLTHSLAHRDTIRKLHTTTRWCGHGRGFTGCGFILSLANLYYRYIIREIHLHGIICTHSRDSLWTGGFTSQTLEDTVNWKGTLASLNPIASPFLNHPTMDRSPPTNTCAHFAASLNWTRRIHSFGGVAATVLGLWRSSSRVLCTWGCLCASVVRPASANWQLGDGTHTVVVSYGGGTHMDECHRPPPLHKRSTTHSQFIYRIITVLLLHTGPGRKVRLPLWIHDYSILHAHGRERGDLWRQQRCRRRRPCPRCIPLI